MCLRLHFWLCRKVIRNQGQCAVFNHLKTLMISFKGVHFPKEVILYAVFFYVRYGVSYRDLEENMEERGVKVDHATLNR